MSLTEPSAEVLSVLHVVPYFPPDRIGGVGEVVAQVHQGLLKRGYRSRVMTSGSSCDQPSVRRIGRSPQRFALKSWLGWRELHGVDVLHAHHGEALLLLLVSRLRHNRPRILLTIHSDNRRAMRALRPYTVNGHRVRPARREQVQRFVFGPLKVAMDWLAMGVADEVTFVSRQTATDMVGARRGHRAHVVHNAVPLVEIPDGLPDTEWADLLYVGRPGHGKRTDVLPSVLACVRSSLPDAGLRIVGFDLRDWPRLRAAFQVEGLLGAVVCEGSVRSEELPRFYQAAGVLVVPSAYEGLPMVIMEAMQAGLPCVATRVGGIAEIVEDGVNGFLVDVDDPNALAERCSEILVNPELGKQMASAGQQFVRSAFSLTHQLEEYLRVYETLSRRKKAPYQ